MAHDEPSPVYEAVLACDVDALTLALKSEPAPDVNFVPEYYGIHVLRLLFEAAPVKDDDIRANPEVVHRMLTSE